MQVKKTAGYWETPLADPSPAIQANAFYFSNPDWAEEYFTYCHRNEHFRNRWLAAAGDWTGKVVLDVGCGPGNVFATLGGKPRLLIGVDVAGGSLEIAAKQGYTGLLADAAKLPLRSGFADIVAVNASIHHCEDMGAVLTEAARAVKPGGMLITDHDPQLSAWNYKGLARLLWNARLMVYRVIGHGFHKTATQQNWGLQTEIHHRPGPAKSATFLVTRVKACTRVTVVGIIESREFFGPVHASDPPPDSTAIGRGTTHRLSDGSRLHCLAQDRFLFRKPACRSEPFLMAVWISS